MQDFFQLKVTTWQALLTKLKEYGLYWMFRGQSNGGQLKDCELKSSKDCELKSSLERALDLNEIPLQNAHGVEKQLIREFQRRYEGDDRDLVVEDLLYCLALMQHHGAPTRLLDWTYSPFVAAFFALESFGPAPVIWCLNGEWCENITRTIAPAIINRHVDVKRKNETFINVYFTNPCPFVFPENPFRLHNRLITQQGVFLCPGDVRSQFTKNLKTMYGWEQEANIIKISLDFDLKSRHEALQDLFAMNISRATLFPGLDGFAQSLKQRLMHYKGLADLNTGESA